MGLYLIEGKSEVYLIIVICSVMGSEPCSKQKKVPVRSSDRSLSDTPQTLFCFAFPAILSILVVFTNFR